LNGGFITFSKTYVGTHRFYSIND